MTTESTALVPITAEQFPALVHGSEAIQTIRTNLMGEEVTPNDLPKIKVPTGGGVAWTVATPDGDEDAVKRLDGIVIHVARRRAYWASTETMGEPPQCSSSDCNFGLGSPGGECAKCPLNAFGSATKADGSEGRGKACKESRLVFLLREGRIIPEVVVIPPSSLKALRQYQLNLGMPYWSVVTGLTLERTQNQDGISYAKVCFRKIGVLPPDASKQILTYAQQLQTLFAAVVLDQADLSDGPQEV